MEQVASMIEQEMPRLKTKTKKEFEHIRKKLYLKFPLLFLLIHTSYVLCSIHCETFFFYWFN